MRLRCETIQVCTFFDTFFSPVILNKSNSNLYRFYTLSGSPKVSSVSHSLQKIQSSENINSVASNAKCVVPVIHSTNVKPTITKTAVASSKRYQNFRKVVV